MVEGEEEEEEDKEKEEEAEAWKAVWSGKPPSAGERCVFPHTRHPLATTVWRRRQRRLVAWAARWPSDAHPPIHHSSILSSILTFIQRPSLISRLCDSKMSLVSRRTSVNRLSAEFQSVTSVQGRHLTVVSNL